MYPLQSFFWMSFSVYVCKIECVREATTKSHICNHIGPLTFALLSQPRDFKWTDKHVNSVEIETNSKTLQNGSKMNPNERIVSDGIRRKRRKES